MELAALQKKVASFTENYKLEIAVPFRLLDLMSEAGELAKENLKSSNYGRTDFAPSVSWAEEVGDVFFALLCIANSTNLDLEEALSVVLDKYQKRLNITGQAGSGA
jgi:NTP pyrophosphatase (non-canonical NTP hydrolase)